METYGKAHSDSTELLQQVLGEAGRGVFPSQVLEGPNGTFAVVLNRITEDGGGVVPEKGFMHEQRGLLFVDPTPGADGVIACYADQKPEPRAEFTALCGGAKAEEIRYADADPSNALKAEVGPLLKEVVELTSVAAQNPGTPEAAAAEKRGEELQNQLKPLEKFFGEFLTGDTGRGVPMGFEDKGQGIFALQLREVSGSGQVGGPCGQILLDTRPGLPGFNAYTKLS